MFFSLSINFWIGTLFLIILIFYLIYIIRTGHNIESLEINKSKYVKSYKNKFQIIKNITLLLFGVFALKLGADMLVKNTIDIASYFGISDRAIAIYNCCFRDKCTRASYFSATIIKNSKVWQLEI